SLSPTSGAGARFSRGRKRPSSGSSRRSGSRRMPAPAPRRAKRLRPAPPPGSHRPVRFSSGDLLLPALLHPFRDEPSFLGGESAEEDYEEVEKPPQGESAQGEELQQPGRNLADVEAVKAEQSEEEAEKEGGELSFLARSHRPDDPSAN